MLACARLILYTNPLEYFTMSERTHRPSSIASPEAVLDQIRAAEQPHHAAAEVAKRKLMNEHAYRIAISPHEWQWLDLERFAVAFSGNSYSDTPDALTLGTDLEYFGIGTEQLTHTLTDGQGVLQPCMALPKAHRLPELTVHLPVWRGGEASLAIYALSHAINHLPSRATSPAITYKGTVYLPTISAHLSADPAVQPTLAHDAIELLHLRRPDHSTVPIFGDTITAQSTPDRQPRAFRHTHLIGRQAVMQALKGAGVPDRAAADEIDGLYKAATNPYTTAPENWDGLIKQRLGRWGRLFAQPQSL